MGGYTFAEPWFEVTLEETQVKASRARHAGRPATELQQLLGQALG